jgi:hypothetical protein
LGKEGFMANPVAVAADSENFITILWRRGRSELLHRPLFIFGVVASLILLAAFFYWPIRITKYGKLTELEQLLFQIFLVALPAVVSWALAKRKEQQNVLATQKALARSAVRRISNIGAAANRLAEVIEERKGIIRSGTDWSELDSTRRSLLFELFDGLSRQVTEIRDNITASEGDWRDILPEEFAKKEEVEREILKARELAIEERERAYSEREQALVKGEARSVEQIKALDTRLAKQLESVERRLTVKVEQIRSQLSRNTSFAPAASGQMMNIGSLLDSAWLADSVHLDPDSYHHVKWPAESVTIGGRASGKLTPAEEEEKKNRKEDPDEQTKNDG